MCLSCCVESERFGRALGEDRKTKQGEKEEEEAFRRWRLFQVTLIRCFGFELVLENCLLLLVRELEIVTFFYFFFGTNNTF
jgi:hypothetical protein